jgi:hypothetical protein
MSRSAGIGIEWPGVKSLEGEGEAWLVVGWTWWLWLWMLLYRAIGASRERQTEIRGSPRFMIISSLILLNSFYPSFILLYSSSLPTRAKAAPKFRIVPATATASASCPDPGFLSPE